MDLNKIMASIQYVYKNCKYIAVDLKAIDNYVLKFKMHKSLHWSGIHPLGYKRRVNDNDELDFLFLIGSQAFCFWGYPHKWTIEYKKTQLDGWWALVACFERALENGIPILDGKYLSQLTFSEVRNLFKGKPEIPLIEERLHILREIGKTLVNKYEGKFHNFYKKVPRDSYKLLEAIVKEFNGFNDVAVYKGRKIYFYKKAQVVVIDTFSIFESKGYGRIKNIHRLVGHSDYKIPSILRNLGILVYNKELANKVDKRIELKANSEEEVEIRANMLWASKLICEKLKHKYTQINPILLNGILWNQSQNKKKIDKPYHLTKTIYY